MCIAHAAACLAVHRAWPAWTRARSSRSCQPHVAAPPRPPRDLFAFLNGPKRVWRPSFSDLASVIAASCTRLAASCCQRLRRCHRHAGHHWQGAGLPVHGECSGGALSGDYPPTARWGSAHDCHAPARSLPPRGPPAAGQEDSGGPLRFLTAPAADSSLASGAEGPLSRAGKARSAAAGPGHSVGQCPSLSEADAPGAAPPGLRVGPGAGTLCTTLSY